MPVCKGIYVTVNDDTLADALGIFEVITALYIVSDVVADDYIIRVA
jgi:hypothetical protein